MEQAIAYGLKPDEFWALSMREWLILRRGMVLKARAEWNHTSSLMAQQYNMNLPRGKKQVKPEELNPYVMKLVENAGVETKEDVQKLADRLLKL